MFDAIQLYYLTYLKYKGVKKFSFLAKLLPERQGYVVIILPNEIWSLMWLINVIEYAIMSINMALLMCKTTHYEWH